jgi:HlyD family secretion protein
MMNKRKHLYRNYRIFQGQAKVLLYLLLISFSISCSKGKPGDFTVMTGSFRQSVTEAGELEAIKASYIMMPRIAYQYGYQFKLIGLAENGKLVHKGDSIIKLDPSTVYKYIIEREDMLENELAAAKKQAVQGENNIQELNAQYRSELAAYDLKKLEVERSKFDTDVKKRIKELEFQQATIRLNKIKRNYELKPKLDNYDFKIQRIRVIQRETELKSAKETLKQFLIRSPLDGTFQVSVNRNYSNPQNWRLGDSPYQGYIIASIPDITKMKAKTYINEAEFKKVKPGMKVIVRLDALPSVPFNGIITEISKICFTRDREKVFNVVVEIAESDMRLKPGMTVNCEYILYESDNDLFVPNNCLLKEKGQSYIFIKRGGSARKIEVQSEVSNSNYTIIKGEVKSGQKLVPFDDILNSKNP